MTGVVLGPPVLAVAGEVLASAGGDDGGGKAVLLLLLLAGPLFAGWVYLRYRNTDKRHHHESETRSQMLDVRADDSRTGSRTGLTSSRMKGANSRKVRAP
ncbi:growth/differentiation factor [Cellulomonas sp. Sa3CUA2]|uniref:Growth/differentiation factor n=1 Tax=Cellulomonas avistercoris TaxID=2762242 RepID=A0ABR8QG50_9CELL|nr:growth/differentiation factor [Cellulomonas avistercoris]MBD7919284.1 growth/differentiation factor [Cellulomonas avistercoris]